MGSLGVSPQPDLCIQVTKNETDPLLPPSPRSIHQLPPKPTKTEELYGYFFNFVSGLCFASVSVLIRLAETTYHLPTLSSLLLRSTVVCFFSTLYLLLFVNVRKQLSSYTKLHCTLLITRGLCSAVGLALIFHSAKLLPVGDAITICFVSPVVTLILATIFLHEAIGAWDWLACAISITGAVLVANPQFALNSAAESVSGRDRIIGSLCAFGGGFLFSVVSITLRRMSTFVHFAVSILADSVFGILVSLLIGGRTVTSSLVSENKEGLFVAAVAGLFAFVALVCWTVGIQHCSAGRGQLIRTVDVPCTYMLGAVFLHEEPGPLSLLGSAMVFSSAVLVGARQMLSRD